MSNQTVPARIRSEHIANAHLYADRFDMIKALSTPVERVGEVGVALGIFSKHLIEHFSPKYFDAFDLFSSHEYKSVMGRNTKEVFGELSHVDYYQREIGALDVDLTCHVGPSQTTLSQEPDRSFDVLYIDGDHRYDAVRQDADNSVQKIKPGGLLIFNDYVMYDPKGAQRLGVVPVANDLIVHHGWRICGFALQNLMFCDIALRLPESPA